LAGVSHLGPTGVLFSHRSRQDICRYHALHLDSSELVRMLSGSLYSRDVRLTWMVYHDLQGVHCDGDANGQLIAHLDNPKINGTTIDPPATKFVDASGVLFDTTIRYDLSFESFNEMVQAEPCNFLTKSLSQNCPPVDNNTAS
jgi:hypothetical protein